MSAAVAIVLAAGMALVALASPSSATTVPFTVNSVLVGSSTSTAGAASANNDADNNPGDGTCQSYAGVQTNTNLCTLKAAIQEANAEYAADPTKTFTINFAPSVQGQTMAWPSSTTGWMTTATLDTQTTSGAVYVISSPITLDLTGMQLGAGTTDPLHGTWFNVTGPNTTIQNFWKGIYSDESSIVVSKTASNVTVTNGAWLPPTNDPERFMVIQAGSSGVNVSNVNLSGGNTSNNFASMGGYFVFSATQGGSASATAGSTQAATSGYAFNGINLGPNIQINQAANPGTCNSSTNQNGNSCNASIIAWDGGTNWDGWDDERVFSPGSNTTPNVTGASAHWSFSGFNFSGNVVNGLSANGYGLCFASGDGGLYTPGPSQNFTINNNVFTNVLGNDSGSYCNQSSGSYGDNLIVLPRFLSGANTISGNVFQSIAPTRSTAYLTGAVNWFGTQGASNNTTPSGLRITDNYFDGWPVHATVNLAATGLVTIENNTFGPQNVSQPTGSQEEWAPGTSSSSSNPGVMVSNGAGNTSGYMGSASKQVSNQWIRTWYPSAPASVLTSSPAATSIPVTTPAKLSSMAACSVAVPVTQGTATDNNTQPTQGLPVNVGVYWTAGSDAEVFLGYAQVTSGTSATLTVPLPVGAIALPMTGTTQITGSAGLPAPAAFSAGSTTIVNGTTGAVNGYLRVQTQVAANGSQGLGQNESSQYSRWVGITGTCSPTLTISQNATYNGTPADGSPAGAPAQAYSSMTRARVFTVTSSMALDPATLTPSDMVLTGSTATNARVVSVTPVTGSNNTQFTVVTEADDSGTIQINLPASSVSTPGGITNSAAAGVASTSLSGSSTQPANTLVYQNPLSVSPTAFSVVVDNADGEMYRINVAAGAPVATGAINITATLPSTNPYPLTMSTTTPTIAVGATSASVTVTATDTSVTVPVGGLVDTITHTVTSSDPNYDGLILSPVTPTVITVDPYVSIQKEVFTGVTGVNTAANIEGTGTHVQPGVTLTDGTPVWFVFHVCNISQTTATATGDNSWLTNLTNLAVNDNVLGHIGTIAGPLSYAAPNNCTDLVYSSNPVAISATQ